MGIFRKRDLEIFKIKKEEIEKKDFREKKFKYYYYNKHK